MIPVMEPKQSAGQPGTGQQTPYTASPMGGLPNWSGANNPFSMMQQHANNALSAPAQGQIMPQLPQMPQMLGGANSLSSLLGGTGQLPMNFLQMLFGGMRQ